MPACVCVKDASIQTHITFFFMSVMYKATAAAFFFFNGYTYTVIFVGWTVWVLLDKLFSCSQCIMHAAFSEGLPLHPSSLLLPEHWHQNQPIYTEKIKRASVFLLLSFDLPEHVFVMIMIRPSVTWTLILWCSWTQCDQYQTLPGSGTCEDAYHFQWPWLYFDKV